MVREGEEAWVIIAEDASLFITQVTSEHTEFCVEETGDGLAAVYCDQDTKTQQEGNESSIIVSLCCPPHLLAKVQELYYSKLQVAIFQAGQIRRLCRSSTFGQWLSNNVL